MSEPTTKPKPPASRWEDVRAPYGKLICRIDAERWVMEWVDHSKGDMKITVDLLPLLSKALKE